MNAKAELVKKCQTAPKAGSSEAERHETSTAAVLTPSGRGAVATVRVVGPPDILDAPPPLFVAANGRPVGEQPLNRLCYGRWGRQEFQEEVVVCRTTENETEIHCHGGIGAVRRVLNDLQSRRVRVCSWQEQLAERLEPLSVECYEALTKASTERTALILLEQTRRLPEAVAELNELAQTLLKEPTTADEIRAKIQERLTSLLRWADFGLHLTEPWTVVVVGRPNVGKSSLINRLLGYDRSIVWERPGTTRDAVWAETAFDGWPVRLCDTAGVRETTEELERSGIQLVEQLSAQADCRLLVLDTSEPPTTEDLQLLKRWPDALIVAHKSDKPCRWDTLPTPAVAVSSLTGEGLQELAQRIVKHLVPETPPADTPLPLTPRQRLLLEQALQAVRAHHLTKLKQTLEQLQRPTK